MKHTVELITMLYERLEEIKKGGLTLAYDEQLRIELALLYDILEDELDLETAAEVEANI